ncbi:MAG TPA: M4 family metallopeptidase [Holophagaceae bacterium]|nr:M4 family metallopeptidase [Holophagaceae bacterium]
MRASTSLTFLSLGLVALHAAPAPPPPPKPRALQATWAAKVQTRLQELQSALGLPDSDALAVHRTFFDARGKAHVRIQQYHRGLRVVGAETIIHVGADGPAQAPLTHHLVPALHLATVVPGISADRALALVAKDLGIQGDLPGAPQVELVVHPNLSGPQAAVKKHKDGTLTLDLPMTSFGRSSSREAYLLAYRVHVELERAQEGPLSRDYLLDAATGVILRKWNSLQTLMDTPDPTDVPQGAPRPKRITGRSEYRGTVSVPGATVTFQRTAGDGSTQTFNADTLWDPTRGTQPHPRTGLVGNHTLNLANDPYAVLGFRYRPGFFFEHGDPTPWGDGLNYDWEGWDASGKFGLHGFDAHGETAGLDVHAGIADTWDYYANIFGRNGIDDQGTSVLSRVHFYANYPNAFWSTAPFAMSFGDGDGTNLSTVTSLDVMGHELSHGVTAFSADLEYFGESGGLNESNSDIMGTMVEFYSRGAGATGTTIPDTGGNWTIGEDIAGPALGGALRWFDRPSRDAFSVDAWFQGVGIYDVHATSGIGNRMFYYLSNGAPTSGEGATPYAPQGFAGIGNDRAARIWYHTLTAYLTSTSDYHDARAQAILAAADLYGAGSAEVIAVENAFGAVNVGPLHGQPEPPVVSLDGGTRLFTGYGSLTNAFSVIAAGATSHPYKVEVLNAPAAEQAVAWSLSYGGGVLDPTTGQFRAPYRWPFQLAGLDSNLYVIQATSTRHPLQFAQGIAYPVMADCDRDLEVDALDMVAIAEQYNRSTADLPYLSALVGDPYGVSDYSVATFLEAFGHLFTVD